MAGGTPSPCSWILLASRAFASHGTLSQSHVPLVQALTRIVAIDGTVMVPAARPPAQLLARTTMAHSLKRKNHAPAAAPRIESPETSNLSPPLHPGPPPNVVEFDAADAHVMNGHARVAIPPNVPQAEVQWQVHVQGSGAGGGGQSGDGQTYDVGGEERRFIGDWAREGGDDGGEERGDADGDIALRLLG
ncbi:hypothetical protein C2857_005042 [Epichloe festucae Fl1]|uniref:Uncharacterized protein n=1 Tax=Epichloe festucae (strain Fl1) TaxID=877507 RepID=A0A7U3SNV9_EPIFF|nr:hypothetical protein C2857_005042 [Epichloe festucae Fl1]